METGTTNPLIHIHIKRTGGTTFRRTLERYYAGSVARNHSVAQLKSIKPQDFMVVQGHFCYGVHQVMDIPPRYFTFLRNPVERALSVIYSGNIDATEQDIWSAIEDGILYREVYPSSVQLAGVDDLDNWRSTIPTREILDTAKRHLEEFEFVGFTKYYRESVDAMCHLFEWNLPSLIDANRSARPFQVPDKSCDIYRTIARHYPTGMELYEWAEDRFLRKII